MMMDRAEVINEDFGDPNDFELDKRTMIEATQISDLQYNQFLDKVQEIPSHRSPINGEMARLAYEFMEDTGTRITETKHVRKKDLDFSTRILTVIHPKSEKQCKCSKWKYKDQYTRQRVLVSADDNCKMCHGKGRWKKPQRTTFTPRIVDRLEKAVKDMYDEEELWPPARKTFWKWAKKAGYKANINIFQQKEDRLIKGMFLHLFRAFCSKRTLKDAKYDDFKDQLVAAKMRHSFNMVTDRYTKIDINYLIKWESETYRL